MEGAGRSGRMTKSHLLSANTIRQRAVKSLDESAKRLKAIEVDEKIHTLIIIESSMLNVWGVIGF